MSNGLGDKLKEVAGGTPSAAVGMGLLALFNRMFSINALNKRLDKHEEKLEKGDRRMSDLYAEQRFQSLILTKLAENNGIKVPPKPEYKDGEK